MTTANRVSVPAWLPWTVAASFLAAFAALAVPSAIGDSATFDETAHLPAGVSYLERHDFRHNAEHPPLAKMWAALPVVALGLADADYDGPAWRGEHVPPGDPRRSRANQWAFGFETLNGPLSDARRRDPARLLVPARCMTIALAVGLGAVVFLWAKALWGGAGGVLAVAAFALSPTMLAHARLVTTDLPAAAGFLATAWLAWRWTLRPTLARAAAAGVVLGAALATKFSALLLPALLAPGLVVGLAMRRRTAASIGAARTAAATAVVAATAWAVVWGAYGFRWSASADPGYRLEWESMETQAERSAGVRVALAARDLRIVPEAYSFGLAWFAGGSSRRLAFLDGETSLTGWTRYFPEAFALKTPIAILALLATAIASALARFRRRALEWAFLAFPPAAYLAISMAANLNLGHRHLAPIYPFLFVGIGSLARVATTRARRLAVGCAVGALAVTTLGAAPGYLSYFNAFAGGAGGGWRHLVDSNVDWGQDLARLAERVRDDRLGTVHLAYFGTADPRAYGLPYVKTILVHDFRPGEPEVEPGPGDVLAISVTLLQGVYLDRDREFAVAAGRAGAIRREDVDAWLALRDRRSLEGEETPSLDAWLERDGRIRADERRRIVDGLRTTRIERIRDRLEPFARAGDSILLYRIPEGPALE